MPLALLAVWEAANNLQVTRRFLFLVFEAVYPFANPIRSTDLFSLAICIKSFHGFI